MKASLDHVGIAVKDLAGALAFYRDALGLEIEASETVAAQRVRAHFVPLGASSLELLEATAPDSPIAKYIEKRGPGLHHITLGVENLAEALAAIKARGVRLIDEQPRLGAEGALVAFIHPSSTHGVLVELKEGANRVSAAIRREPPGAQRFALGDLELISLSDGFFRFDGGAMFGTVPKPAWSTLTPPDEQNRITLGLRPLVVRGTRTMLIDSGLGGKINAGVRETYGTDAGGALDRSIQAAGLKPEDIDIVLATHLHADHAGGFTMRDGSGRLRPRFPRARYVARRGEWETAQQPHARQRSNYSADDYLPLADAGVLDLVDEDQMIMPGVRVQRTGGHTMHHQAIWLESGGQRALYPGDLVPTAAHLGDQWIAALDLYPAESLVSKRAVLQRAADERALTFFCHDPVVVASRIRVENGYFLPDA
jgi:methylmalonyl-CoA epimerase